MKLHMFLFSAIILNNILLIANADVSKPDKRQDSFIVNCVWNYPGGPDEQRLQKLGFNGQKILMAYQFSLFSEQEIRNRYKNPSPEHLINVVVPNWKTNVPFPDQIHLDVEVPEWQIDPTREKDEQKRLQNFEKFLIIINTVKKVLPPGAKISYYNICTTWNHYITKGMLSPDELKKWQKNNNFYKDLIDAGNMLLPSFYTRETMSYEEWEFKSRQILAECGRLKGEKPVYPYICPQYIDKPDTPMDQKVFRKQLDFLYNNENCNGVILWMDIARQRKVNWDENAGWWKEAQDFVKGIRR